MKNKPELKLFDQIKNLKKGKIAMIITIVLACFALTLVMTMQFKIVNETDITSIENMRETELQTELANWKTKYEEAEKQYEDTVFPLLVCFPILLILFVILFLSYFLLK